MGKWSKYAKRTLCMLLSTAMVLTDAGMSVSAAESTAAAETIEENLIKNTDEGDLEKTTASTDKETQDAKAAKSEDAESRMTGIGAESVAESKVEETAKETQSQESIESVSSETKSTEEHTTQGTESEPEESIIEERTEEKTSAEESKTETASLAEIVTETAEAEDTRTEEASSVESTVEETQTEENAPAETTAEDIQTEETVTGETEAETQVQKTETQEVLAEDVIAQGTYEDITWVIDLNGKLTVTGTGDFAPASKWEVSRAPWYEYRESIISAEIHAQGMTSTGAMFYDCINLINLDMTDFDTSNLTATTHMFNGCSSLTSLDFSNFDTEKVCDMTYMFSGCSSLINLDLSSFNTSNVNYMSSMFQGCRALTSLEISSFDTGNVIGISNMFTNCNSLKSLDVSGFNTEKVQNMVAMFSGCSSLTSLDLSNFNTEYVADMRAMFMECSSLASIDLRNFDMRNVTSISNMFSGCRSLTSVEFNSNPIHGVESMGGMFEGCSNLTSLDLSMFYTDKTIDMNRVFRGCSSLTSLDLSSFCTDNVQFMSGMFMECNNLEKLDLSGFSTAKVADMQDMFRECYSLTSLDLSSFYFDSIEGNTGVLHMLLWCDALTQIRTPNNITVSISLPEGVWHDPEGNTYTELPKGIESILLAKDEKPQFIAQGSYQEDGNDITWTIDTDGKLTVTGTGDFAPDDGSIVNSHRAPWRNYQEKVRSAEINVTGMTNACSMFWGCRNMTTVDLSNFDTSQIVHMGGMFEECTSLESLDLSSFDTSNVKCMVSMFCNCNKLTDLNLSSFNTVNVNDMSEMFIDCKSLRYLDLSSFDLSAVNNEGVRDIFRGCNALIELKTPKYVSENGLGQLPQGAVWNGSDGKKYTTFPVGSESITLTKVEIEGIIAYGEYKENGNDIAWEINSDGNLSVTGYGEFAPDRGSSIRAPWYDYRKSIITAEIHVQGMTNAMGMFYECSNMIQVDLRDFDTKNVINMGSMFDGCTNLKTLDLSNFNTENVTNLTGMFSNCGSLTSLDLSSFDTHNVKNVWGMFSDCRSLTNLDLSSFDTGNVIYMSDMFAGCSSLTSLDLSGFDTHNVTAMGGMFAVCTSLESLDLSSFDTHNVMGMGNMFYRCSNLMSLDLNNLDTSNVTNMWGIFYDCSNLTSLEISNFDTRNVNDMGAMFDKCANLTSLDLSNFDTCNVTNMEQLFMDCSNLTSLDLSNFDLSSVTNMNGIFDGDSSLTQLYTPQYIPVSAVLPSYGTWYDIKGNEYIELPQNRSDSILLARDERPTECITAAKKKTSYRQWEQFDISDLTVKYNDSEGDIITLSASDYTTNADQIDTSILGTQVLTVTYNGLTAEINVKITERIRTTVNFTGLDTRDYTYSKKPVTPTVLARTDKGADITSEIQDILVCTYTGTQADGTEYPASNEAPTNAGEYTLTAAIPEDSLDYIGSSQTFEFSIKKEQVTITASDISLTTGAALPKPEDYKYTISSPASEEDLEKKPTLTCSITDTSKEGTYDIVIADAALKSNPNYETEIKYVNGKVEVTAYYTVTFDLSGKGESTTQKDIKKGSTISQPVDPQAEGFTFTGWYKDKECTAKWDFASDKIESNTTLYAGWKAKDDDKDDDNKDDSSEDKDDSAYTSQERVTLSSVSAEIATIKSRFYDGTAYRPGVRVTAVVDGRKVTLTEGTDYRVLYKNNISAGQATVTVKGNGIYKGECTRNFTITAKPVNKLKIVTGGVASGSNVQNLPVYVYDGAVLLKSGTDYTLSGYSAGNSTASVTVTGKGNYTGTTTAKLTVYSVSNDKIINPENVTLNVQSVPYTGKSIKDVEPTVKIGGTTLAKNKDYKVQYQNNKNAGTAFVIVTGKGAYKGKAVVPFTIKAVNTGSMNIKPLSAKTYNGKLQKPAVTVTVNSKKLSKDKDYTVTYKDNLHAGTATVIVTGKGNYAGMKGEAKFTINPQKISKASVKGTQGNLTLTYSKRTLKEGADYEKPVYGTASKNKIKVTIKGKKDFTGEVTKSVKIL